MTRMIAGRMAALLVAAAIGGSAAAQAQQAPTASQPTPQASAPAKQDTNAADVQFMSGMIHHHAQAVLIAGWAPTHGAGQAVRTLCERIVVGQQDEIALMQRWLRERGETVPGADSSHLMSGMDHSAMNHSTMMPGMLTPEQLSQLDHARGAEFDRLFLTFMIQHHRGAITMVDQLFGSQGAAQDETVFRLASDIYADQSTEIDRMQKMLVTVPSRG